VWRLARIGQAVTQLITWGIKLAGAVSATDQLLLHADHPSSVALITSGFMMAGAQFSEGLILNLLEKLMAVGGSPEQRDGSSTPPQKRNDEGP
jgi:hypothetical protein